MADFEMEFELTGLKVKIKSDRAQVPQAIAAASNQLTSMLQSAGGLATGKLIEARVTSPATESPTPAKPVLESHSSKRGGKGRKSGGEPRAAAAIDFKHDAELFGYPIQSWSTAKKSIWLLYVLGEQSEHKELSAPVIMATFNKHFKQFGPLNPKNVGRDMGATKEKTNHLGSDTTKDPQLWFLLEGGKAEAQRLVAESKAAKGINA